MRLNKKILYSVIKWLIMIIAYGYLIYKLANIEYWNQLKISFSTIDLRRFLLLLSVLVLMPLNWFVEAFKWQVLTKDIVRLPFKVALKSVLAGLNTGFVTPSRFGEFAGRIIYLPSEHRLTGTLLSLVNGFIQTFVITVFGLITTYFYSLQFKSKFDFSKYLIYALILLVVLVLFYVLFPTIFKNIKREKWAHKLQNTLKSISEVNVKTLFAAFAISTLRTIVFCFQYYLMLLFFKIDITPVQALIGIPTMYLLITYAPTLAASEAAVRASIAVMILGVFTDNEIGILLSGILIWLINFIVPMISGSVFVVKSKNN